jgi:hypothetical protein
MRNTIRPRKVIRAEALKEVLDMIRTLRCPPGKDVVWEREFADAIDAIARMVENQIAQAEGRVTFRRGYRGGGASKN